MHLTLAKVLLLLMSIYQRLNWGVNKKKKHWWSHGLLHRPQLKGWVIKPRIVTPRKPNSARRSVVKTFLSNKKKIIAYIPGVGHNLRRYSTVLIRGGGARDLPNVSYTVIRGCFDLHGLIKKSKRRSIYGVKWPKTKFKKNRRFNRPLVTRDSKKKDIKNSGQNVKTFVKQIRNLKEKKKKL